MGMSKNVIYENLYTLTEGIQSAGAQNLNLSITRSIGTRKAVGHLHLRCTNCANRVIGEYKWPIGLLNYRMWERRQELRSDEIVKPSSPNITKRNLWTFRTKRVIKRVFTVRVIVRTYPWEIRFTSLGSNYIRMERRMKVKDFTYGVEWGLEMTSKDYLSL